MTGGLKVLPTYSIRNAPQPHVIVVPAQESTAESRAWLAQASAGTDVTMSVCTGAFQLARAGLLKGVAATTHHQFFDSFSKEFPEIELRRGLRYVDSGRIATAGGLTSGIDLALHIVSRYFGVEAAQATAQYMEYTSEAWRAWTLPFELSGGYLARLLAPLESNSFVVFRLDRGPGDLAILLPIAACLAYALAIRWGR